MSQFSQYLSPRPSGNFGSQMQRSFADLERQAMGRLGRTATSSRLNQAGNLAMAMLGSDAVAPYKALMEKVVGHLESGRASNVLQALEVVNPASLRNVYPRMSGKTLIGTTLDKPPEPAPVPPASPTPAAPKPEPVPSPAPAAAVEPKTPPAVASPPAATTPKLPALPGLVGGPGGVTSPAPTRAPTLVPGSPVGTAESKAAVKAKRRVVGGAYRSPANLTGILGSLIAGKKKLGSAA